MFPNIEVLARDYLATIGDLTDLVDPDNICSALPKGVPSKTVPAVRVTRIGGTPLRRRPHWVDQPRVQLEAWAAAKNTAWDITAICHAAFAQAHEHTHDLGVVAGVRTLLGPQDLPDTSFTPAMNRWTFDTVWTVHPHPNTGT